ncbi:N-acetyltransferase family protein, partial [Priestia megaterium]
MIREATKEDLMDILDIYNDAILNTTVVYTYKPETLEDRAVWYNQKLDQGYPILVCEQDNRVVGFASFGPFRAWPAYKYSIEHSI